MLCADFGDMTVIVVVPSAYATPDLGDLRQVRVDRNTSNSERLSRADLDDTETTLEGLSRQDLDDTAENANSQLREDFAKDTVIDVFVFDL